MIRILLLLGLVGLLGYANWRFSLWRLRRELDAKSEPLDDPELAAAVERLARAAGVERVEARVYDMPVVNGLATPDGRVFVTSALRDKHRLGFLKTEEVASVIAHEMGHVALGHSTRRMIDWTGQNLARFALGLILNRFVPVIGFYIANFVATLLMMRLSRRDEFEADRYAAALMTKAGFGVEPQIAMFEKLARIMPGPKGAAWLQSHPPTEERVAAIRTLAQGWERA